MPANTSINAATFIGSSSPANVANVFVDDVVVYNAVPATIGTSSATPKILVTLPGQSAPNTGTPTAQTAGTPFNVTLTCTTDGSTTDTSYSGSKSISFSGPGGSPSYPGTVSFSSGVGTASLTLTLAQSTTLTATDGTIAGQASSSFTVNPGAIASYTVTAASPQVVNAPFNVTVTAKDANANTVTTDSSTQVTMSSSGSVNFTPNPATLTAGVATVSATATASGSITLTATDGNSKTGTSSSITVNSLPQYRSKATGNWNAAGTWEVSTDDGNSWGDAVSTPTSTDGPIAIRNGHTVTVSATVTADQITVQNGGNLTLSAALTVANGSGDDIVVQNGGVLVIGSAPTFNSGSTANINGGGILRVSISGYTGAGTGMNAANYIYENGAIAEYTLTSTPASSSVTFFPNVDASTIPTLKFTATVSGWGAANPTAINGIVEVGTGATVSLQSAGTKTFRNGIRGAGNMSQGSAGQFIINGSTAELGGSGTLTLGANGLQISSSSVTTMSSDKTMAGTGALTLNGTLDLNGNTLTAAVAPVLNGTLVAQIDKTVPANNSKLVLSTGTLAYGGTLTVNNVGAALTGGEVFNLFDAGSFSGSFGTVNLPGLDAGLNWYQGKLAVDGTIIVNRAPVAHNDVTQVQLGQTVTLSAGKFMINDTDADGDTLTVTAASALHGTASVVGGNIQYAPPTSGTSDTLTYTVSDGFGGTASATIAVTLLPAPDAQGFNRVKLEPLGANTVRLTYLGIPGTNYALDWRTNLSLGDWVPVITNPAAANGLLIFTNTSDAAQNYFRTRYVP